jgi:hypothetical protein
MSADWVLGVDFGTTTTAAATRDFGQQRAEILRFGDGYRIPSAVLIEPDGSVSAGPHVEQEGGLSPERVERCPKKQLGHGQLRVGGSWFRDVELVGAVLRYVYQEALEVHGGRRPSVVRLTHPVRWEVNRQAALRVAADIAGMGDVVLVPEPLAAAKALIGRASDADLADGEVAAVFDFGGGTLDIALLRYADGKLEMMGPAGGDELIGGENVNDILVAYLASQLPQQDEANLFDPEASGDPAAWERAAFQFARAVRLAKEGLVVRALVRVPLTPPLNIASLELADDELNRKIVRLIHQAADRLEGAILQAGLQTTDVAAIFLAGGSSRLTLVRRVLGARFSSARIPAFSDPKALVAYGAAEEPTPQELDAPAYQRSASTSENPSKGNPAGVEPAAPNAHPEAPVGVAATTPGAWPKPVSSSALPTQAPQAADAGSSAARRFDPTQWAAPVPHSKSSARPATAYDGAPRFSQALADQVPRSAEETAYRATRRDGYRIDHWLVNVGDRVNVFSPLAWVSNYQHGLGAFQMFALCSGIVTDLLRPAGLLVDWTTPLLNIGRVDVVCSSMSRLPSAYSGVELVLPTRPALDPIETEFVEAALSSQAAGSGSHSSSGVSTLPWAGRYGLFCPAGRSNLVVRMSRGAGAANLKITIRHKSWVTVRYEPPANLRRGGKLSVVTV